MFAIWMCKTRVIPSRADGEGPLNYPSCHTSQIRRRRRADGVRRRLSAREARDPSIGLTLPPHMWPEREITPWRFLLIQIATARSLAVCAARDDGSDASFVM